MAAKDPCAASSLIGRGVITEAAIELIWQGYVIAAARGTHSPAAKGAAVSAVGVQALADKSAPGSPAGNPTLSAAAIETMRKAVALATGLRAGGDKLSATCASITVRGFPLSEMLAVFAARIYAMYEQGDMRIVDIAKGLIQAGEPGLMPGLLTSACAGSKLAPNPANMSAWIAQSAVFDGTAEAAVAGYTSATHAQFLLKVAFNRSNPLGLQARAAAETLISGSIISALQSAVLEVQQVTGAIDRFVQGELHEFLNAESTASFAQAKGEGAVCQLATAERLIYRRYADAVAMLLVNPLSEAPALATCSLPANVLADAPFVYGKPRMTTAVNWQRVQANYFPGEKPGQKTPSQFKAVPWGTKWQPIIEAELFAIGTTHMITSRPSGTYGSIVSESAKLVLPSFAHAIAAIPTIMGKLESLPLAHRPSHVGFGGISTSDAVAGAVISTYWQMQGSVGLMVAKYNCVLLFAAFDHLLSVMPGSPNLTASTNPGSLSITKGAQIGGATWDSQTSMTDKSGWVNKYGGSPLWGYVAGKGRTRTGGGRGFAGVTRAGPSVRGAVPAASLRMGPCVASQIYETKKTAAPWEGVPLCVKAKNAVYYTPWNTAAQFAEILKIADGAANPYFRSNAVSIAPACGLGLNQCPLVIAKAFADANIQTGAKAAYSARRAFASITVAQWMANTSLAGGSANTTAGSPQAMWSLLSKMNSRAAMVITQAELSSAPDVPHLSAPLLSAGAAYGQNLFWGGLIFFLVLLLTAFARLALGVSVRRTVVQYTSRAKPPPWGVAVPSGEFVSKFTI
jgi:hypothetical protein